MLLFFLMHVPPKKRNRASYFYQIRPTEGQTVTQWSVPSFLKPCHLCSCGGLILNPPRWIQEKERKRGLRPHFFFSGNLASCREGGGGGWPLRTLARYTHARRFHGIRFPPVRKSGQRRKLQSASCGQMICFVASAWQISFDWILWNPSEVIEGNDVSGWRVKDEEGKRKSVCVEGREGGSRRR